MKPPKSIPHTKRNERTHSHNKSRLHYQIVNASLDNTCGCLENALHDVPLPSCILSFVVGSLSHFSYTYACGEEPNQKLYSFSYVNAISFSALELCACVVVYLSSSPDATSDIQAQPCSFRYS